MPPAIICDKANEMIFSKFTRKLKEISYHFKQTEPFTPWLNAVKREVKELKKGSSRKLIKSSTPKRLWDDCLELVAYIRSNTQHFYKWDEEFPQIIVSLASFVSLNGLNG